MLKRKGKTCMFKEPSHVKQLSLNHLFKIGLKKGEIERRNGQKGGCNDRKRY
jgi:hypothetical protein